MKVKSIPKHQAAVMGPIADSVRELIRSLEQQRTILVYMASMVEPRVLDPSSGVRLDADTLTIMYPEE